MKKILISIFLSTSLIILIIAFVSKATGKPIIRSKTILNEIQYANIGFDIKNDLEELTESLNDINTFGIGGENVLEIIEDIGKTIYYFGRFLVKMIIHSLVACINIIILVLRITGIATLEYFHLTNGDKGLQGHVENSGGPGSHSQNYNIVMNM